jgi:hypothetical protein
MKPKEVLDKLEKDSLYVDWRKRHQEDYLTHFFCQYGNSQVKSPWEIGFFDPKTSKISVFVAGDVFALKPEDEVFKKAEDKVEQLDLSVVKLPFNDAVALSSEKFSELFPGESFGDGFLILQTWQGKTVWNFTLITKTLKFANLKINDFGVVDFQTVELVDQKA